MPHNHQPQVPTLPDALHRKALASGDVGRRWIADLDAILVEVAAPWELQIGVAFTRSSQSLGPHCRSRSRLSISGGSGCADGFPVGVPFTLVFLVLETRDRGVASCETPPDPSAYRLRHIRSIALDLQGGVLVENLGHATESSAAYTAGRCRSSRRLLDPGRPRPPPPTRRTRLCRALAGRWPRRQAHGQGRRR